MAVTEIGDPRLKALFGSTDPREAGVRPVVQLPRRGLPPLALAAVALVFGVLLFMVLNERRTSQTQPSVRAQPDSDSSAWQAPPPLYVPPLPAPAVEQEQPLQEQRPAGIVSAPPLSQPVVRQPVVQPVYVPQPVPQFAPPPISPPPQRTSSGAPLVIDTGNGPASSSASVTSLSPFGATSGGVSRMRASQLANRSMTVPQGYLIPAVLETGFDSTQPGFARAMVSRDVRSFDGSNVLIPRGSKLVGEYRSEVGQGQKRAVIIWTRLIRPDGMTITMDSPAVDPVGRGGVPASVNTHFFARLGDALLQSTIGIGSALAQRAVTGPVLVIPTTGATGAVAQAVPTNSYVPTLKVPAGKAISVFVAHDLDFSAAGPSR